MPDTQHATSGASPKIDDSMTIRLLGTALGMSLVFVVFAASIGLSGAVLVGTYETVLGWFH